MDQAAQPAQPEQAPRRWDPIVKLTHWGIVLGVIGNALVTEEGSGWHIWVGYALAALLGLRLLWGLIGSREARFSAFPPSPGRAIDHLGEIGRGEVTRHDSHNPLGALMVYAIWGMLLVIAASGIAMSGPPPADPAAVKGRERGEVGTGEASEAREAEERGEHQTAGALLEAGEANEGEEGEEWLAEAHEIAVNLLYVLIALHLSGVVFETRRSGREAVRSMLPGGSGPA